MASGLLAAMDSSFVLILAVVSLVLMGISMLRRTQQRQLTARDLTREQMARLREQGHIRQSIEELLLQLEEVSRRINAQVETKFTKLELVLRDADERIARLESLTGRKSGPPASADRARPRNDDTPAPATAPATRTATATPISTPTSTPTPTGTPAASATTTAASADRGTGGGPTGVQRFVATTLPAVADALSQSAPPQPGEPPQVAPWQSAPPAIADRSAAEPPKSNASAPEANGLPPDVDARPPAAQTPPADECRRRVYELADAGTAPITIADSLRIPLGEVELILGLRGWPRQG